MSVKRELSSGDTCELSCDHVYPLEMSPCGGVPSGRTLEVKKGTRVVVAKDCGLDISDVPFNFAEESLKKHGGPFFAHRFFLEEVRPSA